MNENLVKRYECLAQTVIKGLQSRNMSGYYAANKEEALKQALELIPEGSSIAMGGCMSAHEIGLIKALEECEAGSQSRTYGGVRCRCVLKQRKRDHR